MMTDAEMQLIYKARRVVEEIGKANVKLFKENQRLFAENVKLHEVIDKLCDQIFASNRLAIESCKEIVERLEKEKAQNANRTPNP